MKPGITTNRLSQHIKTSRPPEIMKKNEKLNLFKFQNMQQFSSAYQKMIVKSILEHYE
jgi:hypothetical protein